MVGERYLGDVRPYNGIISIGKGRSQSQIDKVCEAFTAGCAKILHVAEDKIHINLMEIDGKWAMEGGFVMPSPGEEDEWMEKVTKALAERESQIA